MNKNEIKPYLRQFVTATCVDGRSCSGYIANPDEIMNSEDPEILVHFINGMFTEEFPLNEINSIKLQKREDTVSIPVVGLKPGYEVSSSMLDDINKEIDDYLKEQETLTESKDVDTFSEEEKELEEVVNRSDFSKRMMDMKNEIQDELDDIDDFMDIINQADLDHKEIK